jgi:hypothetical protein
VRRSMGGASVRMFAAVLECTGHAHVGERRTSAALGQLRHVTSLCSVMVTASSSMLSGEIDLRMYNAHVACQRIVA